MLKYKNVIWDFDGVILDSMPIRDKGFEMIFKAYPVELTNRLLVFHRQNGGLSRFVKIKYFYEEILGKTITDEEVNFYASDFSKLMRTELDNLELLIEDSVDFIKQNFNNYNFHIVSGSEQSELRFLVDRLGLNSFFKSVYGSPIAKKQNVQTVIQENGYLIEDTCLIGDSHNDHEACVFNNINFLGYNNPELSSLGVGYIEKFSLL